MTIARLRGVAATLLVAALAACSGASGTSIPAAVPQGATHKIKAKIRITIPKRKHHRRIRVRGRYVSPATQSIAIAITPQSGPVIDQNQDLTPDSAGCTAGLVSPLICTVTLTLDPGSYTASFTTYDGLLADPNDPTSQPGGNQLSTNQNVPLNIVAGQANQIDVALDGIPVAVALVPAAASSLSGNVAAGFTASKCGTVGQAAERISIFGIDADENVILGPGAPTVALSTGNQGVIAVSTPGPNNPNSFVLTHPISSTMQGPVQLTATVNPAYEGSVRMQQNVNVSIAGGSNICGLITEYAIPSGSGSRPQEIVKGPDNAMWFAEYRSTGGKIGRITTDGTVTEYDTPTSASVPFGITAGADGNLWFTESGTGKIGKSTTAGVITELPTGLSGNDGLIDITSVPSGDIWTTQVATREIGLYSSGSFTAIPMTTAAAHPQGITMGPDNKMYVASNDGHILQTDLAGGSQASYSTNLTGAPAYITTGPDNALWFTEIFNGGLIGRMTTTGMITEYQLPAAGQPTGITSGPDGNLWFADVESNRVGGVTTSGSITEFVVPTNFGDPAFIATGPDGALWFTECGAGKIGRLQ